jgi:glycosyltransferase involved in cell wall biosynthesis
MRIAYTCHDSFPSSSTNTQQTFWTIVEVARLGVSVELFVPSVQTIAGQNPRATVAQYYGASIEALPETWSISALGDRPLEGSVEKGWFDWRIARRLTPSLRATTGRRHDLVWTRDPLALVSCLRAGLPTFFETYRPDFAAQRRFAPWRRMCLASPHLCGVVTHSRLAADAYVAARVPPERVLVARNGFAPSLLEPVLSRAEARIRLALPPDGPLAVYAGHVGPDKGVDVLVRMAAAVPDAWILLVGASPDSIDGQRLREVARQAGVRNVLLRPRVPLADVSTYLYAADCLMVPPTDEPLRRFRRTVLPMKVFMYLAAGRPILAPRLPDLEEVLTDHETARLVPPDDVQEAGAALAVLLADRPLQERLSRNALAAATAYTWSARARRIADFIGWTGEGSR